jgi:hypothetical protein
VLILKPSLQAAIAAPNTNDLKRDPPRCCDLDQSRTVAPGVFCQPPL